MSTDAQKLAAAEGLAAVLDQYLLSDIAGKLTCSEANRLAEFVTAFNGPCAAEQFLAAHAEEDDEGDLHYLDAEGNLHDRSDEADEVTPWGLRLKSGEMEGK